MSTEWQASFSRALEKWAHKEYLAQLNRHAGQLRRARSTFRYCVPQWHADAVEAMGRNDEEAAKRAVLDYVGTLR